MASYGYTTSNGGRDHVCRPVHVDAQGRRTPLGYLSNVNGLQGYVVKAVEGVVGGDHSSEPLIRGGAHGVHHAAYASTNAAEEDQDLFEKIRRGVSRPKSSWNTMQEQGKYAAATAAAQQILHHGSSGKYSSSEVVPQPAYYDGRETINSEEARRRYGSWGAVPPPRREYYGTVDSAEAAKRYGGVRF